MTRIVADNLGQNRTTCAGLPCTQGIVRTKLDIVTLDFGARNRHHSSRPPSQRLGGRFFIENGARKRRQHTLDCRLRATRTATRKLIRMTAAPPRRLSRSAIVVLWAAA